MDVLYYLLAVVALALLACIPVVLIRPSIFSKVLGSKYRRLKGLALIFIALLITGTLIGVTEPASVKNARLAQESANDKKTQAAANLRSKAEIKKQKHKVIK